MKLVYCWLNGVGTFVTFWYEAERLMYFLLNLFNFVRNRDYIGVAIRNFITDRFRRVKSCSDHSFVVFGHPNCACYLVQ